jgi:hypothetical protein
LVIEGDTMAETPTDNFDTEDVPAALARTTADGSGFASEDELPESDFAGFAESDVENEETSQ